MSGVYTVLVTGANAGLGFATCCRLIDEFLATRPQSESLRLIVTTRDERKSKATLEKLRAHAHKTVTSVYGSSSRHESIAARQAARIELQGEIVDLLSLSSVEKLANTLVRTESLHIDALVLNAGIGGWSGLDWPRAIWTVMTDVVNATTWPDYKIGHRGRLAHQKLAAVAATNTDDGSSQSVLGETFTANVFGHYLLAHMLMPVLRATTGSTKPADGQQRGPGRIVWISSIEAQAHSFDILDLQGLTSNASYESSKRLTDLLVLSSNHPSARPYADSYLSTSDHTTTTTAASDANERVAIYVCHPGICATSIADLPLPLHYAMIGAMYLARWLGSPWHPIDSYKGAMAGVWLALAPASVLTSLEEAGTASSSSSSSTGKSKWGSSTDRVGNERVLRTDVAGWGWSGIVGDTADEAMKIGRGKHVDAKELTERDRDEFLQLGGRCWREMEKMRVYWAERLKDE